MSQIQWFPGHMARARREITEKLNQVDVVIELLDARIPSSSRNPMIDEMIKDKPRVIALNKMDIADPILTKNWQEVLTSEYEPTVAIDAQHNRNINQLKQAIKTMMVPYFDKMKEKGVKPRAIRLMILGIPNVGKSTLINRFVGKNQAQTGNKPGVTKQQRWLKIGREFELLDTPGILWPKFEDPDVGVKLAITGAIKDSLLHMDDLALFLLDYLRVYYPEQLTDRYHINTEEMAALSTVDLLLLITERMNLKEDYEEASRRLLIEFRQNKLGNITLDRPEDKDHGND